MKQIVYDFCLLVGKPDCRNLRNSFFIPFIFELKTKCKIRKICLFLIEKNLVTSIKPFKSIALVFFLFYHNRIVDGTLNVFFSLKHLKKKSLSSPSPSFPLSLSFTLFFPLPLTPTHPPILTRTLSPVLFFSCLNKLEFLLRYSYHLNYSNKKF